MSVSAHAVPVLAVVDDTASTVELVKGPPAHARGNKARYKSHKGPTVSRWGEPRQARRGPPDHAPAWGYRAKSRDEYCRDRYRSYDPATGMYRTYSGRWVPCL
ncbi:BA14K family protein [Lutibaculum baratangense]|uniref:BA14K family protein n=1 Tax=Lutibaculum baratangense TaxID=1358440 RepID=UPI003CC70E42